MKVCRAGETIQSADAISTALTDPDFIQKILDHIETQPLPLKPAATIQS
jgi:hypothetical protein